MKVSFITASYNYAHYITQTIESIQSQTIQDWELIVVDDGSKDNSVEVIKSYCQKDSRIKLFQHENGINKGLIATIKLGIKKASSDWIAFVESDDFITPDYLEKKLIVLNQNPTVDCIFNEVNLYNKVDDISEFSHTFSNYLQRRKKYLPTKSGFTNFLNIAKERNPIPTFSCVMIKKSILQKLNFCSPSQKKLDWFLWSQVIPKFNIFFLNETLTNWRIHKNSYISAKEATEKEILFKLKIRAYLHGKPSILLILFEKYPSLLKLLVKIKHLQKLLFNVKTSSKRKLFSMTIFGIKIENKDTDTPCFLKIRI